ncbi:MAG: hypothetical protein HKN74_08230 [Acidimicrobiia bacterium]|nr:hypothetical protein [Acidimicrobiia bacterium]NNF10255.1 hypothetical protein [Acidimicrobiia bacterium]
MATITYLNGVPVRTGGYWTDTHGHTVLVCEGQMLPSCPSYPYRNTMWQLRNPLPCPHDHTPKGPQAA